MTTQEKVNIIMDNVRRMGGSFQDEVNAVQKYVSSRDEKTRLEHRRSCMADLIQELRSRNIVVKRKGGENEKEYHVRCMMALSKSNEQRILLDHGDPCMFCGKLTMNEIPICSMCQKK